MRVPLLPVLIWLCPSLTRAQAKEVSLFERTDTIKGVSKSVHSYKPEIFTSGFIDIVNNGQINASARFLRLYIGEPGKFAIPLSFYGGVSNNSFQGGGINNSGNLYLRSNDHLINQFINPLSGLINISSENIFFFSKKDKITCTGLLYQLGERVLTGMRTGLVSNPQTGKPFNFLNSFASAGIYWQTGAWEKNNSKNIGAFWMAVRYHACYTNPKQLREFLPDVKTNGLYLGYSIGFGVEINSLVNLKAIYYKYTKQPEIDYGIPIYQFSFNYSLKN